MIQGKCRAFFKLPGNAGGHPERILPCLSNRHYHKKISLSPKRTG